MTSFVFAFFLIAALFIQVIMPYILMKWIAGRLPIANVSHKQMLLTYATMVVSALVLRFCVTAFNVPQGEFMALGAAAVASVVVIHMILKANLKHSLLIWMMPVGTNCIFLMVCWFFIRPHFLESFIMNGNSMAPTIRGKHFTADCPICGAKGYSSPPPDFQVPFDRFASNDQFICDNFHVFESRIVDDEVRSADRVFVNKLIRPKRWDVIVFQYPENPDQNYVMRLVGLPGEKLQIKQGAVWINDQKTEPPKDLANIQYESQLPNSLGQQDLHGATPITLGSREYFVLGDYSLRAKDSRMWQYVVTGKPPYAVPEEFIAGVATHVYWRRWKMLK